MPIVLLISPSNSSPKPFGVKVFSHPNKAINMKSKSCKSSLSCFVVSFIILSGAFARADSLLHSGETLAFMGDSITQQGAGASGYIRLVESGLAVNGIEVKVIPAGISGHKSDQMLARLQKHVLDKNPDWMTLSCGVNDVWHGARGVSLEDYKTNITAIVDQCTEAGVKVLILTSTPIKETDNELNQKLAGYNEFLRELAAERELPLADLNAAFWKELESPTMPRGEGNYLTRDGVHMNPLGNMLMAKGILQAFELNDEQIEKAQTDWKTKQTRVRPDVMISVADYLSLCKIAEEEGTTPGSVMNLIFRQGLEALFIDPEPLLNKE